MLEPLEQIDVHDYMNHYETNVALSRAIDRINLLTEYIRLENSGGTTQADYAHLKELRKQLGIHPAIPRSAKDL